MEKRYDVAALGELLIDFTRSGVSPQGNPLWEANPGGAPCNVLAMLTRLGHITAFLGKVGQDGFGDQLETALQEVGIDTRALTKHLRENGSMLGKIIIEGCDDVDFYNPNLENLVGMTSSNGVTLYDTDAEGHINAVSLDPENPDAGISDKKTVVLVDCGVKHNIIRCLTRRGVRVVRVPWD